MSSRIKAVQNDCLDSERNIDLFLVPDGNQWEQDLDVSFYDSLADLLEGDDVPCGETDCGESLQPTEASTVSGKCVKKRKYNPDSDKIAAVTDATLQNLDVDPNSKEGKQKRRQIRNRLSAQFHRDRKNAHISELEAALTRKDTELDSLRNQVKQLKKEIEMLRDANASAASNNIVADSEYFNNMNGYTSASSNMSAISSTSSPNESPFHNPATSSPSLGTFDMTMSVNQEQSSNPVQNHLPTTTIAQVPDVPVTTMAVPVTGVPQAIAASSNTKSIKNEQDTAGSSIPTVPLPAGFLRPFSLISMLCMVSIMLLGPQVDISAPSIQRESMSTFLSEYLTRLGLQGLMGDSSITDVANGLLAQPTKLKDSLVLSAFDRSSATSSSSDSEKPTTTPLAQEQGMDVDEPPARRRLQSASSSVKYYGENSSEEFGNRNDAANQLTNPEPSPNSKNEGINDAQLQNYINSLMAITLPAMAPSEHQQQLAGNATHITKPAVAGALPINQSLPKGRSNLRKGAYGGGSTRSSPQSHVQNQSTSFSTAVTFSNSTNNPRGDVVLSAGMVSKSLIDSSFTASNSISSATTKHGVYDSSKSLIPAGSNHNDMGSNANSLFHWSDSSATSFGYTVQSVQSVQSYSKVIMTDGKALFDPALSLTRSVERNDQQHHRQRHHSGASSVSDGVGLGSGAVVGTSESVSSAVALHHGLSNVDNAKSETFDSSSAKGDSAASEAGNALPLQSALSDANIMIIKLPASAIRVGKSWADSDDGTIESIMRVFNMAPTTAGTPLHSRNGSNDHSSRSNHGSGRNDVSNTTALPVLDGDDYAHASVEISCAIVGAKFVLMDTSSV